MKEAKDGTLRRDFGKIALGSAFGAAAFVASEGRGSATVHNGQPGIKLCGQASAKPTDEELKFWRQIGCGYVSVGSTPDLRTAEGFMQIKKRYADAGITVWNIGNTERAQHAGGYAEPAGPRQEDRGI